VLDKSVYAALETAELIPAKTNIKLILQSFFWAGVFLDDSFE